MSEGIMSELLDALVQSGVAEDMLTEDAISAFFDVLQENSINLSDCSSEEVANLFDQFQHSGNLELSMDDIANSDVADADVNADSVMPGKSRLNHGTHDVAFGRSCVQKCVDTDAPSGLCRYG